VAATALVWYHTDEELLPTAARQPWAKGGAGGVVLVAKGLELTDVVGHRRQLFAGDNATSPSRRGDRVELQWRLEGESFTPTGFGLSPVIVEIDDGERGLMLTIGTSLTWADLTGAVILEIQTNFPWTNPNHFHLIKDRGQAWYLYVNGTLVSTLPYAAAGPTVLVTPSVIWGSIGTAVAIWEGVEFGLNTDLPPEWKVLRVRDASPVAIKKRWNARWRALARSVIGMAQDIKNAMGSVYELKTAAKHDYEKHSFSGDTRPDLIADPWTVLPTGDFSTVRERQRISPNSPATILSYEVDAPNAPAEMSMRATFTLARGAVPVGGGPDGDRFGITLGLRDGSYRCFAQLTEYPSGSGEIGWVLTDGVVAFGFAAIGQQRWIVDPYEPHTVEVRRLGETGSPNPRILLIVDGAVVDDVAYDPAVLLADALAPAGVILRDESVTFDIDTVEMRVSYSDLDRRPVFLQTIAERLVFTGGCERNDHLEALKRHHYGLQRLRGTTRGILLELRRLSCNDDAAMFTDLDEGQWYLESTYPEVTPIFLEAGGMFTDVLIEFRGDSILLSPQELADLAAAYLVPVSLLELQYFIHVAVDLTAATVDTGVSTFTVSKTRGFAVGQAVTLRNAAATLKSDGTILTLDPVTGVITTTLLDNSFAIGAIMRTILATT